MRQHPARRSERTQANLLEFFPLIPPTRSLGTPLRHRHWYYGIKAPERLSQRPVRTAVRLTNFQAGTLGLNRPRSKNGLNTVCREKSLPSKQTESCWLLVTA